MKYGVTRPLLQSTHLYIRVLYFNNVLRIFKKTLTTCRRLLVNAGRILRRRFIIYVSWTFLIYSVLVFLVVFFGSNKSKT